jgi:hypothetical protein
LHRTFKHVAHRRDRQLHRRGIAAGIADAALASMVPAGQFGQAVIPAVVEAVVCGQVDHQCLRCDRIHGRNEGRRLAVGQGQHQRVDALPRRGFRTVGNVGQVAGVAGFVVAQPLPLAFARGNECQFEARMRGDQADQLGADVAAGADDADAFPCGCVSHGRASFPCRLTFTAGHSLTRMENTTVSRSVPSR